MRVAYLTNLNATDGTKTNADRLCREFDKRDELDLTAVHIQGTGAPENFWTDELGYRALYPVSFRQGIETVDPDIVFIHGHNPDMMEWLKENAPEDDRVYVLRNGINVMEQWLALYATPDPKTVTTPLTHLDLFDGVFAPSQAAADRLNFAYWNDTPHMAIAPCTIDYEKYVPTPFRDDGTLRVMTASRIAPNNFIIAPLLAVQALASEGYDIELRILGSGDQPYRRTIDQLTGGMEHVGVVGHVDADEVRQHMQECDVVCVPSVTQQAVPTVAVEALASGCIVLSGGFHASAEEETLVTVPADHPPAWYEALTDILDSPDEATDIIADGLQAAKHYDTEHVVDEAYLPFFHALLSEQEMDDE